MTKGSKAAAKTAGLAKGALKALEGYPGIFHHLAGEHAEVAAMMQRISKSDGKGNAEVFGELRKHLLAHAHAEEQEFYSRLRGFAEVESIIERSIAEHRDVENRLERLAASDMTTKAWHEEFEDMKRAVEAHVELEEHNLFPKARELLTRDQANAIEQSYERAEERELSVLA